MARTADNWVEQQGGLPPYFKRIVRHLREKGMSEPHAIAVAVNTAKRFCATGDTNWPGLQQINAGSRAEACAAVARWEAMKAAASGHPPAPTPSAPEQPEPKSPPERKPSGSPRPQPVTAQRWDASPSRFTASEWRRSCVLDTGSGESEHDRFAIPILEPDGRLNVGAVRAALSLIFQVAGVSAEELRAAARRLVDAYRVLGEVPPDRLLALAGLAPRTRQTKEEARSVAEEVIEQRSAPEALSVEGRKLRGVIPYGVESRDLGGWREVVQPGAFRNTDMTDLVATVDHAGLPLARFPGTLTVEDREDGLHWSLELPESRSDVREAVERGDLCASSWRMVVARDAWDGNRRTVEEVRSLRDVAVVTTSAYPANAAFAEMRSASPHQQEEEGPMQPDEHDEHEVEETRERPGALTVEDRSLKPDDEPDVEARVIEMIRSTAKGETRSLTTANADEITPPQLSSYLWDRLAPQSVALRSGVRVVPTDRKTIQWPVVISDPIPDWVAETDVIPATDPAFDTLEAEPKKLAARTEFSNEVLDDSEPAAEGVVRRLMQRALGLTLDLAFYQGNPSADPNVIRGLKFQSGIQTLGPITGANGGPIPAGAAGIDLITEALGMLEDADVPGPYVAVMRPSVWRQFKRLTDEQGRRLLPQGATDIDGARVLTSNQLAANETAGTSSDTSSIYVYSVSPDVGPVLVRRSDVELAIDRSRLFDRDMSEMRGKTRVDLVLPQPLAVVRVTGVRPAA